MAFTLRVLTAVTILLILASQLNLAQSLELMKNAQLVWVGVALCLLLLLRVLAALRWFAILAHHNHSVSLLEVVEITFISATAGHLLPSGVGGDVVRGVQLSRRHGQITNTAASILIDRVVGIFSMLLMALLGAVIADHAFDGLDLFWPLLLLNVTFVCGWLASRSVYSALSSVSVNTVGKFQRVYGALLQILEALSDRQSVYALLPTILSLSLLTQLVRCAMFYCLYLAFSVELSFIVFIAFIPLVFVVMQLPISIGGLGLREGALIYFFGLLSVSSEISANVGILSHALQLIVAIPGFALWLQRRKSPE